MLLKFIFLILAINLSGCLEKNEIIYVYLSKIQNKLVTKVNGSVAKSPEDLFSKLSLPYEKSEQHNTDLYIIYTDDVAFSDAKNIVGLAEKIGGYSNTIGLSNITLYMINRQTKKMYEVSFGRAIPVADNILTFIGAK